MILQKEENFNPENFFCQPDGGKTSKNGQGGDGVVVLEDDQDRAEVDDMVDNQRVAANDAPAIVLADSGSQRKMKENKMIKSA